MNKTAEKILKEIKAKTIIENVSEFVFEHNQFGNSEFYEEYFKIYGEDGKAVIGRILHDHNGTRSKLDYISKMEFNRNVNLWERV